MLTWAPLLALVPLWAVTTFAPGFWIVRRWKWGPVERLCAAAAISLFIVYLGAFGVYLLGLGRWAYCLIAAGCVLAGVINARDWVELLKLHAVRRAVGMMVLLLIWGTLCQAMTRHYAGGLWSGDWYIHFQKIGIYLKGGSSNDFELRNRLLERPGMMTLIGSYYLGLTGMRFDAFQLIYTWLNVLSVLPCYLMAQRFARRGGRQAWVVAALLMCLPMVWVNATYTWTKLLAGFYVLLGMATYLRAMDKKDRGRMIWAFAFLTAGILVHLVAMPYAAFVFGHYLLFVWRNRRERIGELASIVTSGALVLLTWYGWVMARYGVDVLLASNSTIQQHGAQTLPQVLMKMARNFAWTIFPHPMMWSSGVYEQPNRLGYVRDYMFLLYQSNLPLVSGSVTGLAAAVLAYRYLRLRGQRGAIAYIGMVAAVVAMIALVYVPGASEVLFTLFPKWDMMAIAVVGATWAGGTAGMLLSGKAEPASAEVWFWRGLILFLPVAGAIAIDVPCEYGYAHIFFHPWAMMAVTLVAVHVHRWGIWLRIALALGMLVDFALGVWLHFYLETKSFTVRPDGSIDAQGLHLQTGLNWFDKTRFGYVFVGDHLAPVLNELAALLALGGLAAVIVVLLSNRRKS